MIKAEIDSGAAEAALLRAMRPFVTASALLIWSYWLLGMPLPADTHAEFAQPFRQLAYVGCFGSVGGLMAVWIGGHGAPDVKPSNVWVAIQIVMGVCVMVTLIAGIHHVLA